MLEWIHLLNKLSPIRRHLRQDQSLLIRPNETKRDKDQQGFTMGGKVGRQITYSAKLFSTTGINLEFASSERNELVTIRRFVPLGPVGRDTQCFR
jgi:hypothetical protein